MKPTLGRRPVSEGWWFEPKWDGHRCLVQVTTDGISAVSSSGRDRTTSWSWLSEALDGVGPCVVDGEVIAFDAGGRHDFELVGRPDVMHAFVVFDLLGLEGRDLCDDPWHERRARLEASMIPNRRLIVTPGTDDGGTLWDATATQGFEGVVAKRTDSRYRPGTRSPSWIKSKHRWEQEFVVAGIRPGSGSLTGSIGSLLLGVHPGAPGTGATGDALEFVGAVGSGLGDRERRVLGERASALRSPTPPFASIPDVQGPVVWLRPELVVQVRFAGWTAAGRLRHPVFLGLRDDLDPRAVVAEQ